MKAKTLPPLRALHSTFICDHAAGKLFWLHGRRGTARGSEAGSLMKDGYSYVKLDGVRYPTHRVIWKMVTGFDPSEEIDHINGEKSENGFSNLREASRCENSRNCKVPTANTSGFKGASFNKGRRKWQAQISFGGKTLYLGLFDSVEMAHSAYCSAAVEYFGKFARIK